MITTLVKQEVLLAKAGMTSATANLLVPKVLASKAGLASMVSSAAPSESAPAAEAAAQAPEPEPEPVVAVAEEKAAEPEPEPVAVAEEPVAEEAGDSVAGVVVSTTLVKQEILLAKAGMTSATASLLMPNVLKAKAGVA